MQEKEIIHEENKRYILSKNREGTYTIFKKSKSEYAPIGTVYDLSEVPMLFSIINGHYDDIPLEMMPTLEDVMIEHVETILRRADYNLATAAKILKLERSELKELIKTWTLQIPSETT